MSTENVVPVMDVEGKPVVVDGKTIDLTSTLKIKEVKYTPVGKGADKKPYDSVRIESWKVEDGDGMTLFTDALAFAGGNFKALKGAIESGLNSWKRFADQPGADPVEKLRALIDKLGITAEQLATLGIGTGATETDHKEQ